MRKTMFYFLLLYLIRFSNPNRTLLRAKASSKRPLIFKWNFQPGEPKKKTMQLISWLSLPCLKSSGVKTGFPKAVAFLLQSMAMYKLTGGTVVWSVTSKQYSLCTGLQLKDLIKDSARVQANSNDSMKKLEKKWKKLIKNINRYRYIYLNC